MASTVGSRPNHYDALGLSPAASEDEIARAFGKAMGLFGARSVAAAAQLGVAFETLRNPAKRRAYDASIGLGPKPRPILAPTSVSFRMTARPAGPEPHVEPRPIEPAAAAAPPEPAPEPGPASFIGSALREIAKPAAIEASAGSTTKTEPPRPREELSAEALEQLLGSRAAGREGTSEAEDRSIDWRRPAVAVGAVLLTAGLVGGFAGMSVKDDVQGQTAVTSKLPAVKPHPQGVAPAAAAAAATPMSAESSVAQARQAVRGRRFVERIAAPQPAAPAATAPGDTAQVADANAAPAASEQAAADPLAPQPQAMESVASAGLPLASKLVARTIDRIGYACGEVASTSPAEGQSAGVFKVTCTSGETYRAAPVHGRYRFSRWRAR